MSTYDRSAVMLSRSVDESSVTLTATVTPPEAVSNLRWSKTGEGFDIVPSGTSCTVNGNDSFEGYDAHGQVTAKVDTYGTLIGSQDTCDVSVVKDKGNLIDLSVLTTMSSSGITITREIANKIRVSGNVDSSNWITLTPSKRIDLDDGVYSFDKTYVDIDYSGLNDNPFYLQIVAKGFSSGDAEYTFHTYDQSKALPSMSYVQTFAASPESPGVPISGTIVPFLTKLPDSGQLLGTADLTTSTSGWAFGGIESANSFTFADGNATFVLNAVDPTAGRVYTTNFNHLSGSVYAVFFDAKLDATGKVKVGETNGTNVTFNLTTTMRRYAGFYTASSSQELAITPQQTGTLTISNIKLIKVTVPADMDSQTTLDEPRLDTSLDLGPGLSLL